MTPVSYQGPRADEGGQASTSQDSNIAFEKIDSETTVSKILEVKGATVFSITETTSLGAASTELTLKKIGALPVIDHKGALVGVFSERDVVKAMDATGADALNAPVSAHMTPSPVTCSPGDKVLQLMEIMTEKRFRHLPVTEGERLCGMISIRDLVNSRMQELEYEALRIKQLMVG